MKAKTSLDIHFEQKLVSPDFPLKLGYKKHFGGFIKTDETGRFHITDKGGRCYSIHYDVDTVEGRHMTLPSEIILPKEYKKIIGYIKSCKDKVERVKTSKPIKIQICTTCRMYSENLYKNKCQECRKSQQTLSYKEMQEALKQLSVNKTEETNKITLWQKIINFICKK